MNLKVINPICICFTEGQLIVGTRNKVQVLNDNQNYKISLNGEHFGLRIKKFDSAYRKISEKYGSMLKLTEIVITNKKISIFEENKSNPWVLDKKTGLLISKATFDAAKNMDKNYINKQFNVSGDWAYRFADQLNAYMPQISKKKDAAVV